MNNQKYPLIRIHAKTLELLKVLSKEINIKKLPSIIDFLVDFYLQNREEK